MRARFQLAVALPLWRRKVRSRWTAAIDGVVVFVSNAYTLADKSPARCRLNATVSFAI